MNIRFLSIVIVAMLTFSFHASAQQAASDKVGDDKLIGVVWKGVWQSGTSPATGDLEIQITEVKDGVVKAKLRMTRPNNGVWSCKDTQMDVSGMQQQEKISLEVDFGGRCNKNVFTFNLKDGKLDGVYQTQSGSHGTYRLNDSRSSS